MTRRNNASPDSLEMLLDTMCNTFGGIILIALLIALLARETKVKEAATRAVTESETMLQRRIAAVEKDLTEARARRSMLERQTRESSQAGLFQLVEQREQLRQLNDALTEALRDANRKLDAGAAANPTRVEDAIRQMLQGVNDSERQQTEARTLELSLQEKQRELQRTLQQDTNRLAQATARRVQRLRLPRERETTKAHLYIIARYGKLYPLYTFPNGDPERNHTSLRWIEESAASKRVEPQPGQGVPAVTDAALVPFFRQFAADSMYLVFQVYEDSFAAFNVAKQAAVAQGFEYTWEPRRQSDVLRIGAGGRPPPPQ